MRYLTSRVLDERELSAASGPSLPRPLSPAALPTAGREGRLEKQFLVAVSLLSRKGGCEAGEEGRGGEGPGGEATVR